MEQYPASRASHSWDSRRHTAAPCSPLETPWEQAAPQRCRMAPCRGWSRDLSIGGASRLRCGLGAALHTHFRRALRYQPQPDVCWLDLALCWRCTCHAKRVDGRIISSGGRAHPPGRSWRRAHAEASVWGRVRQVPEAGSSVPLTTSAERQDISLLCCNYLMRKPAEVKLAHQTSPGTTIQRRPAHHRKDQWARVCPGSYKMEDKVRRSLAALLHRILLNV